MLLDNEIKLGKIYAYDIDGSITSSLNHGTYTVKLVNVTSEGYLVVESMETGELFMCGSHMLTDLDRVERMLKGYEQVNKEDLDCVGEMVYNRKMHRMRQSLINSCMLK